MCFFFLSLPAPPPRESQSFYFFFIFFVHLIPPVSLAETPNMKPRERSLTALTRRFLQLFLRHPPTLRRPIALETISVLLLGTVPTGFHCFNPRSTVILISRLYSHIQQDPSSIRHQ